MTAKKSKVETPESQQQNKSSSSTSVSTSASLSGLVPDHLLLKPI